MNDQDSSLPDCGAAADRLARQEDDDKWYCRANRVEYGPIRYEFLLRMIKQGRLVLSSHDVVRRGANGRWSEVEKHPELVEALRGQAPTRQKNDSRMPQDVGARSIQADSLLRRGLERVSDLFVGLLELLAWRPAGSGVGVKFGWIRSTGELIHHTALGAAEFTNRFRTQIGIGSAAVIWIGLNVLIGFFPESARLLMLELTRYATAPITWFALFAMVAYAYAIWLSATK